jgi:hypothetical protein
MDDEEAIRKLIGEHFEAMKWETGTDPDWDRFREDFLSGQNLDTFEEHTRGMKVLRFGNVAVVLAMSEMLENGSEVNHDISGYLLVRSEGRWSIAAHAWDQASGEKPVPDDLR